MPGIRLGELLNLTESLDQPIEAWSFISSFTMDYFAQICFCVLLFQTAKKIFRDIIMLIHLSTLRQVSKHYVILPEEIKNFLAYLNMRLYLNTGPAMGLAVVACYLNIMFGLPYSNLLVPSLFISAIVPPLGRTITTRILINLALTKDFLAESVYEGLLKQHTSRH